MDAESDLDKNEPNSLPDGQNVTDFTKNGFKTLMESIRNANALPTQDYSFYNTNSSFQKAMNAEGNRILSLINNVTKNYGLKNNIKTSLLDHKTELLVEANDVILEKVADNIDEMNGIKKKTAGPLELQVVSGNVSINGSWNKADNRNFSVSSSVHSSKQEMANSSIRLLAAKNIVRPQKFFTDKVDNSNSYPWEPRIKEKPNSLKPLAIFLEETNRGEEFSHPYEFELDNFSPSEEQLSPDTEDIQFPKTLDETSFVEVSTPEQVKSLVDDLRRYKIIAVDLEHHGYRTFMGITCLMQISTRDTDYLIDTLALRNELSLLNEVFTKPSILKVFHGADSDILWLQRDLSLYIVNMFDTFQAAKVLEYASLSLASLLERFCNFKPNKHFQLADWRMRPLPDELKKYAREDTHFLIYIYKMLKKEILKKAGSKLLSIVYQRSTEVCKFRYFKPRWTEESHLDFYRTCKRMFDNRQMFAMKELYKWRDHIAREEDESISYVLPNHMLLHISDILPREMQGILACCNPIPPLVRSNLLEIHQIILKARDKTLEKPILQEDTRARGSTVQFQKINLDSPLHCPHDLSKSGEFRDDLPTLLKGDMFQENSVNLEQLETKFSVFRRNEMLKRKCQKKKRILAPFERYLLVKPFVQDEEEKKEQDVKPNPEDIKPVIAEVIEIRDDIDKVNEVLDDLVQEDKTDEERIASIRRHFGLLSKKTQEDEKLAREREEQIYQKALMEEKASRSLVHMGGTKKRKREPSGGDHLSFEDRNIEHRFLNPAPYHTSDKYVPLGKKQKRNEQNQPREGGERLNQVWKQKNKKRKNFQKKNEKTHDNQKIRVKTEEGTSSQNESKSFGKKRLSGNQDVPQRKKARNSESNFEAFDYASVDFRQFQGGGQAVNQGKNIKSQFKNKGKNKNVNKAFNKSGVFSNRGRRK